jgi:peptide/nickel transport system permease protein
MKIILYYGKKVLLFFLSVLVLSLAVFYISRLTPTDPLLSYYGERVEKMSVEEKEQARKKLGLDDPIYMQYLRWVDNALDGDFGISYKYKQDVWEVIRLRIGNTLILGGIGYILTFLGALLLGLLCAWFEDRLIDRLLCKLGTLTSCIPEFWFSLVLILVFCVSLRWLPSSGAYSVGHADDLADRIVHLILPMTIVLSSHLWYYAYMVRNKLLEEARADYVLLGKSKGLTKKQILLRHCLRNIMPSFISIMAISVPHVLGGTYIVETVFGYPGIGTLSYESARYADYNMLMVLCMLTGITVIFCNIIGQIINEHIDPRMKANEAIETSEVTTV